MHVSTKYSSFVGGVGGCDMMFTYHFKLNYEIYYH